MCSGQRCACAALRCRRFIIKMIYLRAARCFTVRVTAGPVLLVNFYTSKQQMMWWAVWCAAAALCGAAAAPGSLSLAQADSPAPDEETLSYLLPALSARYAPASTWRGLMDPNLYMFSEMPRDHQAFEASRQKRKMPSLSINNPMEVLRQRLLLEIARKQMREASQRQAEANRAILQNVGKRGLWADSALEAARYDN